MVQPLNLPPQAKSKSKAPSGPSKGAIKKRNRLYDARKILTNPPDPAISKNGDVDMAAFVKAREFEIQALRKSMGDSKGALSSRAFQEVPRHLRRRMASHNVKKVPKRLRSRAAKEIQVDNTPTGKARTKKLTTHQRLRLAKSKGLRARNEVVIKPVREVAKDTITEAVPKPTKFRRRQLHKSWLPTHIWHAKRSRMTEPKNPLWRFALALTPTEKCYRSTHRAASARGCVAFDTSYMATIKLEGTELSLLNLFRCLGAAEDILTGGNGERWRSGSRSKRVWLCERDRPRILIAPAQVIWAAASSKRSILVRVHPSAFLSVWNELIKVGKMQCPQVHLEDLRFQIGSIEVAGPGATEALASCLRPIAASGHGPSPLGETVEDDLDDSTNEFAKAMGFEIDSEEESDSEMEVDERQDEHDEVADPNDSNAGTVWSSLTPLSNPAALPADIVIPLNVSDPRLRYPPRRIRPPSPDETFMEMLAKWPLDRHPPALDLIDAIKRDSACRRLSSQKAINRRRSQSIPGSWPDPLPQDPKIPILLTTSRAPGSNQGIWTLSLPWDFVLPIWYSLLHYPMSTGGTPRFGGLDQARQLSFEQGRLWFPGDYPGTAAGQAWEHFMREQGRQDWERRPRGRRPEYESLPLGLNDEDGIDRPKGELGRGWACDWEFFGKGETYHLPATNLSDHPNTSSLALTPIQLSLAGRGHPERCARIYRLPTTSEAWHRDWIKQKSESRLPEITETGTIERVSPKHPAVPLAEDLVGFVTSTNYHLGHGDCRAFGSVLAERLIGAEGGKGQGLCIVRNSGESVARLAHWQWALD